MSKNKSKSIEIPILTRVEGEGALAIEIADKKIHSLQLKIYEPPRLFEKFLEGRDYKELLDIVARICGICPVAYQMSAVHAIEACFHIQPTLWVREMRRLFYCGEWLESHSIHIHFLAAPDFLGFTSAPEMAKIYPDVLRRGLRLQSLGIELIELLGGRSVHPVGACIGGFYKAPNITAVHKVLERVRASIKDCEALIEWILSLPLPDNTQDFICVSLKHPFEYPMNEGRIVSDHGLDIAIEDFELFFKEFQVSYSNALHSLLQGKPYLVGPLARLNINYERMPSQIKAFLKQAGIGFPSKNMVHSILARAVEVYYCVLEALRILENYAYPTSSYVAVKKVIAGKGYGCTEAPRGLLWHSYVLDGKGLIQSARIVPPTSQNQARIEEDLGYALQKFGLDKSDAALRAHSEMIIRNYDPCISCATHFLTLQVRRK